MIVYGGIFLNLRGNKDNFRAVLDGFPFLVNRMSELCFFVNDIVDDMDLSEFEKPYEEARCNDSYSRVMLLKVNTYGLLNGVLTFRKLEHQISSNVEYMFLAGFETPSYRTIIRFKDKDYEMLEDLFLKTVDYAYDKGYIDFKVLLYDSTTKQAHANTYKRLNQEKIDYLKRFLKNSLTGKKSEDMEILWEIQDKSIKKLDSDFKKKTKFILQ